MRWDEEMEKYLLKRMMWNDNGNNHGKENFRQMREHSRNERKGKEEQKRLPGDVVVTRLMLLSLPEENCTLKAYFLFTHVLFTLSILLSDSSHHVNNQWEGR